MRASTRGPSVVVLAALACLGCAAALHEPPLDQQLWRRNDCFAHMMSDWRVLTMPALAGVARNAGASEEALPGVTVYARQWNAEAMQTPPPPMLKVDSS